ncbi:hypothetical protein Tco_1239995 [Tanacetum coccineum]
MIIARIVIARVVLQELLLNHLYLRIAVIMEYLVKISKKARILELKRRHLKITVLTSYTPYPSRKIRCICACTSQKTTKEGHEVINRIYRRNLYVIELIRGSRIEEVMAEIKMETTMDGFVTNDRADYYSGITRITVNGKNAYELKGKFLDDLLCNTPLR